MLLGKTCAPHVPRREHPPERQQQRERKKGGGGSRGSTEGPGGWASPGGGDQRAVWLDSWGGVRKSLGRSQPSSLPSVRCQFMLSDKAASELMEAVLGRPPGATHPLGTAAQQGSDGLVLLGDGEC